MKNFDREELGKIYDYYMNKYTESFFKRKMEELPDYWEGYEELSYGDMRRLFKRQLTEEAIRSHKTMDQVFKSFINGNMFVDPDTRYGRNAAKGMKRYDRELYDTVSEYLGKDLSLVNVKAVGDKVFDYTSNGKTVRVTCLKDLSPKELLSLAGSNAYIVEFF